MSKELEKKLEEYNSNESRLQGLHKMLGLFNTPGYGGFELDFGVQLTERDKSLVEAFVQANNKSADGAQIAVIKDVQIGYGKAVVSFKK